MEYLQIVQNGLEILLKNIKPFIEEALSKIYGNNYWIYLEHGSKAVNEINLNSMNSMNDYHFSQELMAQKKYKDVLFYINGIIKNWEALKNLFSTNYILCLCHDIKYFRNKWAHQSLFTAREAHRFLDQSQCLLEEMKLDCSEIDVLRKGVMEMYFNEEVNKLYSSSNNNIGITGNQIVNNNIEINSSTFNQKINYNNLSNFTSHIDEYNKNNNNNTNNKENLYSNYSDDLDMIDGQEIDRENLHIQNYEKLINSSTNDKNNSYTITYYEQQEEDENNINTNK